MAQIRRGEKRDILRLIYLLKQVNRIHFEARRDIFKLNTKYDTAALEKLLQDPETPVFVYEDDKGVVRGYAMCRVKVIRDHPLLQDAEDLYIDDLCVDEAVRGTGVGRALFERVCRFAGERGFRSVFLNVWAFNENARAFYEKMGMTEQRVYMEKILPRACSGKEKRR